MRFARKARGLRDRGSSPGSIINLNLRYFWYPGFLTLVFFAPLARGLFFPGDLLPYQVVGAVVLLLAGADALLRGDKVFSGLFYLGFLWLGLSYGVSSFGAVAKSQAIQGFLRYMMYFGILWLSWYMSRTREGRQALLLTIFLSALTVACIGILAATGVFPFPGASAGARIMSTLQYPNALAAYMMFSSFIGLTLWLLERRPVLRLLYASGVFLQTLVFLSSFSRGGWVIYPFALVVLGLGLPRKYKGRFAFSACGSLTAVLLLVRQFITTLETKSLASAQRYVLFGVVISLAIEGAYLVYESLRERTFISEAARKVVGWISGIYAFFTFTIYTGMLLAQYDTGLRGILPGSFIRRLATISLDDPSLLTRAFATKDALDIFLDRPFFGGGAGAWNALYHQYQRVLYWTTEVHNHFAQVLVETGLLGFLAYAFIWSVLVWYVVRSILWRSSEKPEETGEGDGPQSSTREKTRLWGLGIAALALGAHSLMDFELSLPGVFYHLCAILGIIEAQTFKNSSTLSQGVAREKEESLRSIGRMRSVSILVIFAVALVVGVPSYLLQRAGWYGSLGAQALVQHDFLRALLLYQRARELDPYEASYLMDMAQAYTALSLLERRPELKEKALACIDDARRLNPSDISHRLKEVEILTSLGEVDRAREASFRLTQLVPLDVRSYEIFARTSVIAYIRALKEGTFEGRDESNIGHLGEKYLQSIVEIPGILEGLKLKVQGAYGEKWSPDKLNPSPGLCLYIGQAYFLKGDAEEAKRFLEKAKNDKTYGREASDWLLALRVHESGIEPEGLSEEVKRILSYCRVAQ